MNQLFSHILVNSLTAKAGIDKGTKNGQLVPVPLVQPPTTPFGIGVTRVQFRINIRNMSVGLSSVQLSLEVQPPPLQPIAQTILDLAPGSPRSMEREFVHESGYFPIPAGKPLTVRSVQIWEPGSIPLAKRSIEAKITVSISYYELDAHGRPIASTPVFVDIVYVPDGKYFVGLKTDASIWRAPALGPREPGPLLWTEIG